MSDSVSKSWFVVLNNPEDHGYIGTPQEIIDSMNDEWISGCPTRTGAWIYCISADGLKHVHMVLEDVKAMRFSLIKKAYPVAHIEATKGSKEQAEDYINKRGKWEEKGEQVIAISRWGEIKGRQGQRRDLEVIEDLINSGMSSRKILSMSFGYRRYEKMIRSACMAREYDGVPFVRDVNVVWHVGESGSGKSFTANKLIEEHGENYVYFMTDYEIGGFDAYSGEHVLFLDEFRGQWKYSFFLNIIDCYKTMVHARYANIPSIWQEVHITSVKTPDMIYKKLIVDDEEREIDTFEQLRRRINTIVYHWKDKDGNYNQYELPMNEYKSYGNLMCRAYNSVTFTPLPDDADIPFKDSEK